MGGIIGAMVLSLLTIVIRDIGSIFLRHNGISHGEESIYGVVEIQDPSGTHTSG